MRNLFCVRHQKPPTRKDEMPGRMLTANRRWRFFYLAGMPAELCDSGTDGPAATAEKIKEEWTGQRGRFLEFAHDCECGRRGAVFNGRAFIAVCVS